MLAALTLMVISIYFWKKRKNIIPLILPMLLIMVIALWSLIIKFQMSQTLMLQIINGILIFLILWMFFEGLYYIFKNYNHFKRS